jgi:hypothetical protein
MGIADHRDGRSVVVGKAMVPVHPGEILLEEFVKPLGVSQYQLAKQIGVPARRVHGKERSTFDSVRGLQFRVLTRTIRTPRVGLTEALPGETVAGLAVIIRWCNRVARKRLVWRISLQPVGGSG